jgi:hypothetical protein
MRNACVVSILILVSGSLCAQDVEPPGEPEIVEVPLDFAGLEIEPLDDGGVRLSLEAMDRVNAWKLELWKRRQLEAIDDQIAAVEARIKAVEEQECQLEVKRQGLEADHEKLLKEEALNETKEAKRKEKIARWKGWALELLVVGVALL